MWRIETERLVIRPLTMDDLDPIHTILDVDLRMGTKSRQERREWLQWTVMSYVELEKLHQPPYGERAVVLREKNTLIGAVGFVPCLNYFRQLPYFSTRLNKPVDRQHCTTEVGLFWAIASAYQRQGYATEAARGMIDWAFANLHLRRIVATTEYDNAPSMGVMRRLGMTIERNPFPDPFWLEVVGILEDTGSAEGTVT